MPRSTPIGGYPSKNQREKARRIYTAAVEVMAAGCGLSMDEFNIVVRTLPIGIFRAPPSAAMRPQPADVIDDSPQVDDEPSSVEQSASTDLAEEGQFQSDASPPDASVVDGGEEPEPEPVDHSHSEPEADVLQRKPATQASWDEKISSGLVTLRDPETQRYLNLDGSGYTDKRQFAYRGTVAQARAMRNKNPLAKGMSFRTFSTPRT